jgi:uncharacterized membrane protein
MEAVESINKRMRILLILQAIGFFSWQAGDGVAGLGQTSSDLAGPAFVVSGVGFGVWIVSLIIFFGQALQAKKVAGYDVLNDEWARDVRKRAAEAAFWVITIGVVLSMTATNFGADGQLLLKVLTGLSVASFFVATVIYDSRGEGSEDA